jgi:cellulose synthase/poly-beta-1,6-N-acetylglucosamine synthase-like glycosyltransferase
MRWKAAQNRERDAHVPFVSVMIPVRNERRNIVRCLAAIRSQDYRQDRMEVIFADAMSTDGTREIIASSANSHIPVRIVDNPEKDRAHGLNAAIRAAKGDLIVRVDARSVIGREHVSRIVRALLESGADNAGCVMKPIAEGLTQEAAGLSLSTPFGVGNAQYRLGGKSGFVDQVYLGCYRRELFERVGYFDDTSPIISEDSDMNQRIWAAGGKVYLDADIIAHYYPRETFREFWKLSIRYGGARAGNLLKHRRLTSWRQTVAPSFVLVLAILLALGLWNRLLLAALGTVLTLYLLTDAGVSWYLAKHQNKPALFPRLVIAFACLHFGWALGFWKRILTPQRPGQYWPD